MLWFLAFLGFETTFRNIFPKAPSLTYTWARSFPAHRFTTGYETCGFLVSLYQITAWGQVSTQTYSWKYWQCSGFHVMFVVAEEFFCCCYFFFSAVCMTLQSFPSTQRLTCPCYSESSSWIHLSFLDWCCSGMCCCVLLLGSDGDRAGKVTEQELCMTSDRGGWFSWTGFLKSKPEIFPWGGRESIYNWFHWCFLRAAF